MFRKMSRSFEKDQNLGNPSLSDNGCELNFQSDEQKQQKNTFFNVSGMFIGSKPKGLSDFDSVGSPKSPLDFRIFSNLGNPFRSLSSPRSLHDNGHSKSWDSDKVGLSIISSLDDNIKISGPTSRFSNTKNIIIAPQIRVKPSNFGNHVDFSEKPKSVPKNYAILNHGRLKSSNLRNENSNSNSSLFEIGDDPPLEPVPIEKFRSCSLDSGRRFSTVFSARKNNRDLRSRFYHLENSTTHEKCPEIRDESFVFDEFFPNNSSSIPKSSFFHEIGSSSTNVTSPRNSRMLVNSRGCANNFLRFCYFCKKNLDGEDIYMYRGEKPFCSMICREQEILVDEESDDLLENINKDNINNSPL